MGNIDTTQKLLTMTFTDLQRICNNCYQDLNLFTTMDCQLEDHCNEIWIIGSTPQMANKEIQDNDYNNYGLEQ